MSTQVMLIYMWFHNILLIYLQLDLMTKFRVAVQLSQAVTFLHTNAPPIAHLDIKPSNILVSNIIRCVSHVQ